jgi:hypothetical protein
MNDRIKNKKVNYPKLLGYGFFKIGSTNLLNQKSNSTNKPFNK